MFVTLIREMLVVSRLQNIKFMNINKIHCFLYLIVGFLVSSCAELPCDETDGVLLKAGLYKYDGSALTDTSISMQLHYGVVDTLTYFDDYSIGTQTIDFPLSLVFDETQIIFLYEEGIADTILIHHTSQLTLESHACGFVKFYDISEIETTTNRLDSVRLVKSKIEYEDYEDLEHIKIFY